VTVAPSDVRSDYPAGAIVVTDITSSGVVNKSPLRPTDLTVQEVVIGQAGTTLAPGTYSVSGDGVTDCVRIAGTLGGNITLQWVTASKYNSGETVRLVDASGSLLPQTNTVTVVTVLNGNDTFNANSQFVFDEAFGQKILVSDNANPPNAAGGGNWSVSLTKAGIQSFQLLPLGANSAWQMVCNRNVVKQNAHINLLNGFNSLTVTNYFDGMDIELIVVQPASSTAGTLALPLGSYVSGNGLGVLNLSTSNGFIDRVRGSYDGASQSFYWDQPIVNFTSAVLPAAPTSLALSNVQATQITLTWTDASTNETGFTVERHGPSGSFSSLGTTPPSSPASATGGTITYIDKTCSPGTAYTYRVAAYNAGGLSPYNTNGAQTATTLTGGPTADFLEVHFNDGSGLKAVTTVPPGSSSTYLALNYAEWVTPGASGVTGSGGFAPTAGMAVTTGTGITTVGTGTGGAYTYKVNAYKNGTTGPNGLHNQDAIFTTTVGILATSYSTSNYNVITWSPVTTGGGADYYTVYRTAVPTGSSFSVGLLAGTGNGFTGTTINDVQLTGTNAGQPLVATLPIPADLSTVTDQHTATFVNGSGNTIDFGTSDGGATHTVNQISCSFWCKSTYTTTGTDVIIAGSATGNTVFRIASINGHNFQISYPTGTGTKTGTVSNNVTKTGASGTPTLVNAGTDWHLIIFTLDNSQSTHLGTEIKLYYDNSGGTAETTVYTVLGTGPKVFAAGQPQIGSVHFSGSIDDVRIYNHILSTTEMTQIWGGGTGAL
jgi:hypothetical protein